MTAHDSKNIAIPFHIEELEARVVPSINLEAGPLEIRINIQPAEFVDIFIGGPGDRDDLIKQITIGGPGD